MRRVVVVAVLAWSCWAVGQRLDPHGSWVGDTYVDEPLGFSYHSPKGYGHQFLSGMIVTPGSEFLFVVGAPSANDQVNGIRLVARDVRLDNSSSCSQIHSFFEKNLPVVPGTTLLAGDREIRLAGKRYRRIDFKEKNGKQFHSYLCSERRGFWLYWDIEADSVMVRDNLVLSIAKTEYRDEAQDADEGKYFGT